LQGWGFSIAGDARTRKWAVKSGHPRESRFRKSLAFPGVVIVSIATNA